MNYFDQDGHLNDAGIALYADAVKLDKISALPKGLRKHLDTCSKCQHQMIDFSAIMLDLDQDISIENHPYFGQETKTLNRSVRSILIRLAFAATLGALVFFAYRHFVQPQTPDIVEIEDTKPEKEAEQSPQINDKSQEEVVDQNAEGAQKGVDLKPKPPVQTPEEEGSKENVARALFAANFVPNEDLESMIGTVTRSEGFTVLQPLPTAAFEKNEAIIFKWKDKITLKITILDNQEETKFEKVLNDAGFDFKNNLDPGIYYWKLETEEDLLHLGKLIIE